MNTVEERAFRAAMSLLPTGVTLVTTGGGATLDAVTVNSFTSVSLEPLLVAFGLRTGGRLSSRLGRAPGFAVHVLAAEQQDLAAQFARRDRPSGRAVAQVLAATVTARGNVLVGGALATFECRPYAAHPAGDHCLVIGQVVAIHEAPDASRGALLFHRGAYETLPAVAT